jgi:hypothetical protein
MMLILRKRVVGLANAIDAIIDDIDKKDVFPPSLQQITGTTGEWDGEGLAEGPDNVTNDDAGEHHFNDDDILLAKEANNEQMQLIL